MAAERKTLTQLSVPICLETLFYMLSGMVDTLMLSSVSDQAVGAVGTANTYIGVFIIMFGVISSGMIAVMSQNIGAGRPDDHLMQLPVMHLVNSLRESFQALHSHQLIFEKFLHPIFLEV